MQGHFKSKLMNYEKDFTKTIRSDVHGYGTWS